MSSSRQRKIEGELQRVLSELIAREVSDPRVGKVTITAVDVAPDLRNAKVYFVPFVSQQPLEEVQAGLSSAGSFLRGEVARRLNLRYAPRLHFVFDKTIDHAARLTDLIDKATARDSRD